MSNSGTESEGTKFWWKLALAERLSTPEKTSLECRFVNARKKEESGGDNLGWQQSDFKPGNSVDITCPNGEIKIIDSHALEHCLKYGEHVERFTISTPKDMKHAIFRIEYAGESWNIDYEVYYKQRRHSIIDSPIGDKTRDDSGYISPNASTLFSPDETSSSVTPFSNEAEATPRGRTRATSSPPYRSLDFDELKSSE